ncbi:hypothetical protein T440DRAFT_472512, partial [Plenodomus tracheiphilus IPT5]
MFVAEKEHVRTLEALNGQRVDDDGTLLLGQKRKPQTRFRQLRSSQVPQKYASLERPRATSPNLWYRLLEADVPDYLVSQHHLAHSHHFCRSRHLSHVRTLCSNLDSHRSCGHSRRWLRVRW